ncbi:methyl-accepting chemotaxis protein [Maricaulis parjimensis]|uniref:methyl-accepting chemotaxis protein n=1 Tax=Maricaulis parjimensis TaxID=144023 RepID=UPI0019396E64|nr:methyl-accepting chemotaxis protein [Maricaulis parjimensis]
MTGAAAPKASTPSATAVSTELLDRLLSFLSPKPVSQEDCRDAWNALEPALNPILDDFYARLVDDPDLAAIFSGYEDQAKNIAARQVTHWRGLMTEHPGINFQGRSVRIAEAHVRIGLPSHWYIAAYGRVLSGAIPALFSKYRLNPKKAERVVAALISRAFLDICAAQEGYENGIRVRVEEDNRRDTNLASLRSVADTIVSINDLSLNMALLQSSTEEATSNSQSISAAAEELLTSVQQIAENSDGAAERARSTNASVHESIGAMDSVASSIADIARTAEESAQSLKELNEASEQISDFLSVIETIADQTNLLALNATIEAARAGEAGKGFAVVASEVKSLATQAAKATEDISERISALKNGMAVIERALDGSRSAVENGQSTIEGANSLIRSVGDQVSDVTGRMEEISSILKQQESTTAEISTNITGVADRAGDNRNRLDEMAQSLKGSNDTFLNNAQDWFVADSHRSLVQMAKIDHVVFKKKIVDTVSGYVEGRAVDVPDHHNCRLGKWYDGLNVPAIRNHKAYRDLVEPHKRVHAAGRGALEALEAGDRRNAYAKLVELEDASQEVLSLLETLAEAFDGELKEADSRHVSRRPVKDVQAQSRSDNGQGAIHIENISEGGLGIAGAHAGEVGETIQVEHNGQTILGEIAWKKDGKAGVRLLKGKLDV